MAISQEVWNKAKEYFEAGLSLSEIVLRTEISKAQISKKSKIENWQKGNEKKQLIAQAIEVATKKETLNETALDVHNEIVNEQLRRQNLVFNASEKALKKLDSLIDMTEDAQDMKHIVDSIDKASITLGVNQRHANSQVNISNTNATQTNIELNKDIVLQTLKSFDDEY